MTNHPHDLGKAWARALRVGDEYPDRAPRLLVHREGRVVAVLTAADPSALLRAAGTAGVGYGAEALTLVLEGVVPLVPVHPGTGEPWRPGETEDYWRAHPAEAGTVVSEVLVVGTGMRNGEVASGSLPFARVGEGHDTAALTDDGAARFVWGTYRPEGAESIGNALVTRLQVAPADPGAVRDPGDGFVAAPDAPFFSPERGRVVLDIGTTRLLDRDLGEDGGALLVVDSDRDAEPYRAEGLMPWQVLVVA